MRKMIQVTPCFCRADLFNKSRYHLTTMETEGVINERVALLNKYPLDSIEDNEKKLIKYSKKHNYKIWDSKFDRGWQDSLNYFFENNPQPEKTILLGFDADSSMLPAAKGFDLAIRTVMDADPTLAVCACWGVGIEMAYAAKRVALDIKMVAGYRVAYHPSVEMYNVCGIDLDWVQSMGGFGQPFKYYGGAECDLYSKMLKSGKRLAYLIDFSESYSPYEADGKEKLYDNELRLYKNDHLAGYTKSFKEWLLEKGVLKC